MLKGVLATRTSRRVARLKRWHRVPLLVAASFLAGCVSSSVIQVGTAKYSEIAPSDVIVYLKESDIPAPFEKLARIDTSADWKTSNEALLIEKGKKEAAKLGANALLVFDLHDPSKTAKLTEIAIAAVLPIGARSLSRRAELIAIRVQPTSSEGSIGNTEDPEIDGSHGQTPSSSGSTHGSVPRASLPD